ncbi:MAG: 5-dehydro-2-deoxygluconokinase [Paracoccaceae bacterium]|nr:5-dehydro-2-deoxygluconokinase [Paracoccaceae bacterium]
MSVFGRLARNHFLVVGRGGMDIYPHPAGDRIEDVTHFFACLGGSSANIAVAIVRLGGRSSLVTTVSDDAVGRFVRNELGRYGVDHHHVRTVGGSSRTSLAVVESRVEDHQTVLYRNGAADFDMSADDVEGIDYSAFGALITTGTVFAAEPSRSAGLMALELGRAAGLPLVFDIDHRPYSWPSAEVASDVYSRVGSLCDFVIGNDDEFGFMAGDYSRGLDKARDLSRDAAGAIVYKMGERGAITFSEGRELRTGVYPVTALKPTGAGDAFMGGLMSGLAAGLDIEKSVLRGSACAAIVVSKVGCAPAMPDPETLESFLDSHPGPVIS